MSTFAPAVGVPTGTVTVLDGAIPIANVALDATGRASITTSSLTVGTHDDLLLTDINMTY